jgi:hypothetical protein
MAVIVYSDESLKKRIDESLRALVSTPGFARANVSKKELIRARALAILKYTEVFEQSVFSTEPGALLVDVVRWAVRKSADELIRWSEGEHMPQGTVLQDVIFFVVDSAQMVVNPKIMSRERWTEVNSLLENQLEGFVWFVSYSSVARRDGTYNLLVRTPRQVPAFANNAKPAGTGSFYHLDEMEIRGGLG